jgi:hypothetical protein
MSGHPRSRSFHPSALVRTLAALALLSALTATAWAAPAQPVGKPDVPAAQGLRPRQPAGPASLFVLAPETPVDRIVVKFHEGSRVRLRGGDLVTLPRSERDRAELAAHGLGAARVTADARAIRALVASDGRARGFGRLFQVAEKTLADQRATGEAASGEQLADLDLYFEVLVPAGAAFAEVEGLVEQLDSFPSVEIAYAAPVPEVASTGFELVPMATTPNFQSQQGYLNPAPGGIDANYAWTKAGGSGFGVIILDVEFAWRTTHEDFPTAWYSNGTQSPSLSNRNHGTAVIGEMLGLNNGFGVKGIAYGGRYGWVSAYSQSAASAIATAAAALGSGNMILIELHQLGPTQPGCGCSGSQCHYVPMEWTQAEYDAIKAATANGKTVIEAAGNGSADLNDAVYGKKFYRTFRDSGAVLVGARNSANGFATCFSNYGYRVDVNAWGENVVTTGGRLSGPGDLYNGGTEDQWYTATFGGTSSASPIVTGAAACIQGASFSNPPYTTRTPSEIRMRLMSNGTWEWSNSNFIGPQPNLRGAIDQLINGNRLPTANTDFFTTPKNTVKSIGFGTLLANDTDPDGDARSILWYDFKTLNGGTADCCHGGGFNYTPPLNFTGTDHLNYRIQDARGLMAIGTVTITVQ